MGVISDIRETYRSPRKVVRRHLSGGVREDRALIYLMLACGLIFVAQWPRLSREAALNSEIPLEALLGAALLGWLFIAPLFFYGLAAVAHVLARLAGGQGSWFEARMALFWALLAVAPLWLLHGLVAGFVGSGPGLALVGVVLLVAFLLVWGAAMIEAEFGASGSQAAEGN